MGSSQAECNSQGSAMHDNVMACSMNSDLSHGEIIFNCIYSPNPIFDKKMLFFDMLDPDRRQYWSNSPFPFNNEVVQTRHKAAERDVFCEVRSMGAFFKGYS